MPIYEYRCNTCLRVSSTYASVAEAPKTLACEHCGAPDAPRIISRTSYHRSDVQKLEALDPKYDQMAERALRNTSEADPDRLLRKMTPFTSADD
jgi:putative FmdB family regulatory protein